MRDAAEELIRHVRGTSVLQRQASALRVLADYTMGMQAAAADGDSTAEATWKEVRSGESVLKVLSASSLHDWSALFVLSSPDRSAFLLLMEGLSKSECLGITLDQGKAADKDVMNHAVLYRLLGHAVAEALIRQVKAHSDTLTCEYQGADIIIVLADIAVVVHASPDRWQNVLDHGLLSELQPSDYSRDNCPSQVSAQNRFWFRAFIRALRFAAWINIAQDQMNTFGCVDHGMRQVMSQHLESDELVHFFGVIVPKLHRKKSQ
jgi:hypothetical protein